ncbi:MAG TPA: outer membrane protein assembly factor BamD [Gammaproteobacteria bacterium]|jgi:outer membrane protein assembly factor BamD|nr:outer membrane protein assembly factor BamD [Gammaproteobacteria bacterium]
MVPLFVASIAILSGCGLFGEKNEEDLPENWPEDKLYFAAKESLDTGACGGAIEHYERLQTRYPFGPYAAQAQLELAYCYYKSEDSASALGAIDRFIKLNPTHPHMDYAYYLRGLINFNIGRGLTARFVERDPSQRDPGAAMRSFKDFSGLIQKFPKTRYVEDAELRMRHLRNILAQHEVNVANFYMRRGAFVAAANRARNVVENYQQTPAMPEALVLLAKSYKVLEMNELSDDALRVLQLNYPNHPGISEVNKTAVR